MIRERAQSVLSSSDSKNSYSFSLPTQPIPPLNPLWRALKSLMYFSFFIECEALGQFMLNSRDMDYVLSLNPKSVAIIIAFVILVVIRWSAALLNLYIIQNSLEHLVSIFYGYQIRGKITRLMHSKIPRLINSFPIGHMLTANRSLINSYYGWASQHLADYIVAHYLIYSALYQSKSQLELLDGSQYKDTDQFYRHQAWASTAAGVANATCFVLAALFYTKFARKEITLFNYLI